MAAIELKSVRKSFQSLEVIHGIDLRIEDGAFTVLVGPSGCGKSTLLRMIAGLEQVTTGQIDIDGERCDQLMPVARGMAMVFQSYALYPHMNVDQNLRFGLENQRLPKTEITERVTRAAEILQISHLLERRPSQLSGGQSQRVAIGRAIVKEPKAFLFDEPLSNLDAELRVKMRTELIALHERLGATMVYVTHDQVEAMTMADRIVVLRDGRIEQVGTPIDLYTAPANQFVAGFLGAPQMNFLPAQIGDDGAVVLKGNGARIDFGDRARTVPPGSDVTVGVRPEHLVPGKGACIRAEVMHTEVLGAESVVHARLDAATPLLVSLRGISDLRAGSSIDVGLDPSAAHLFGADGRTLVAP
jgi:multiple sugar transport system ATP-binding protein